MCITLRQDIVNAICDDDDIKAVSFVGSNTVSVLQHFSNQNCNDTSTFEKKKKKILSLLLVSSDTSVCSTSRLYKAFYFLSHYFNFLILHLKAGMHIYARAASTGKRVQVSLKLLWDKYVQFLFCNIFALKSVL